MASIIAQNARQNEVWFEGFEFLVSSDATWFNFPNNYQVNNPTNQRETGTAHSGRHSLGIPAGLAVRLPSALKVVAKPLRLSVWAKFETPGVNPDLDASKLTIGTSQIALKHVARVGDWNLLEAQVTPSTEANSWLIKSNAGVKVWIDDIRLQPLDATSTCMVYDPASLRLLAQFDDSHFGQFYQYDAEGRLIRKLIETERGLKVASESISHLKTVQN